MVCLTPYDGVGVAEAIWQGLEMPLGERKERWGAMTATLRRNDAHARREHFLAAVAVAGGAR